MNKLTPPTLSQRTSNCKCKKSSPNLNPNPKSETLLNILSVKQEKKYIILVLVKHHRSLGRFDKPNVRERERLLID